jgi:hypothetical protein
MYDHSTSRHAIEFLLGLIGSADAERVRQRIGLRTPPDAESLHTRRKLFSWWTQTAVPSSVLLWVLEEDDPELNALVWRHVSADDAMRHAIVRGVPHGPGRTRAVPVAKPLARDQEPPVPEHFTRYGLIGALRASTSVGMRR